MWTADAYSKAESILPLFLLGACDKISLKSTTQEKLSLPAVLNGGIGTSFLPPSNKTYTAVLSEA